MQSEVNISSTASPAPYAAAQQSLKPTSKIIQLKTKFCRHLEIFKLFSEITASCNTSKLPLLKCTNFQQSSLLHNVHLHGSLLRLARLFLMFLGQRGRRFQRSAFHGELLRLVPCFFSVRSPKWPKDWVVPEWAVGFQLQYKINTGSC